MPDGGQHVTAPNPDRPAPQATTVPKPDQTPGHQHDAISGGDGPHHAEPHLPVPPTHKTLDHPANAPLRAAGMAHIQRGAGNQAALAMLAQARDEPDDPGAEEPEPAVAAPVLPGPQPLVLKAEPIRAAYLGEPPLQRDELRFPPAPEPGGQSTKGRPPQPGAGLVPEAADLAVRRHTDIRAAGQTLHEAALAQANAAVADALGGYEAAMRRLEADDQRASQWLDMVADQQRSELERAADAALQRLTAATDAARTTVLAATKEGLKQVEAAGSKAAGGISGAISHAIKESVAAINKDNKDCETEADKAIAAVTDWKKNPDIAFPGNGPNLAAAKNEVRRKKAPILADPVIEESRKQKTKHLEGYAAWAEARPKQLREGQTAKALYGANAAFRRDGRHSIEQAQEQALTGIAETARSGRRMIAQMRHSGLSQIASLRQGGHTRLDAIARGRRASLHAETASTLSALQGGAFNGVALFARAPGSLRTALREAAPRGPDAVLQVARTTPPGIEAAMANARRLHGDRVAANAAAMRGTAVSHTDQHAAELGAEQAREQQELTETVGKTASSMAQTATDEAGSLDATAAKVGEAASELVTAFSDSFGRQLASGTAGLAAENKNFAGAPQTQPPPVKPGDNAPDTKTDGKAPDAKAAGQKPAKPGDHTPADNKGAIDPKTGTAAKAAGEDKTPEPQTLGQRRFLWEGYFGRLEKPEPLFAPFLQKDTEAEHKRIEQILLELHGAIIRGSLGECAAALRGITKLEGLALQELQAPRGKPLADEIKDIWRSPIHPFRDSEYRKAALAYLEGGSVQGTRYELQAASGVFSADFDRVETIMGSLSNEDRMALLAGDAHPAGEIEGASLKDIQDHLSGSKRKIFDALAAGEYAKAEAQHRFDDLEAARATGKHEAVQAAINGLAGGPLYKAYIPKDHRAEVVAELAQLVPGDPSLPTNASNEDKVIAYITAPMEVYEESGDPEVPGTYKTIKLEDGQRDALANSIKEVKDPTLALVVGLHEELTRPEGPRMGELTTLLIDKRLDPIRTDLSDEELKQAKAAQEQAMTERSQAIADFAKRYGGSAESAKAYLEAQIAIAFKQDATGAAFATHLAEEAHPTPEGAAIGLDWAINHPTFIDASLVHKILSHMDRTEIDKAKAAFQTRTGTDLLERLGVYGKGRLVGGLSGDDRLQAERDLLGVPRNQQEDLEVAHFNIEQQRRETGPVGEWYARGGYGEQDMNRMESELTSSVGRPLAFDREGHLLTQGAFDATGKLSGGDPERLRRATDLAPLAAQNYQAAVDRLSSIVTTVIAVLGAIAAVVITVVTAGAAGPLIVAALATGLATMAAKAAIKGGRYGWKEAGMDLGMTAVQMLTAGAGAALGAASRGGMAAIRTAEAAEAAFAKGMMAAEAMEAAVAAAKPGQILGSQVADHLLIGTATGAIGGAGQAAVNPDTWAEGGAKGAEEVLFGLFRGAVGGLATSFASQRFEAIGRGNKTIGSVMAGLGKDRNASMFGQTILRGGLKAASSGVGAMAGRTAELGLETATGRFHGNADVAFDSVLEAGWQASLRGFGEGVAEAPASRWHEGKLRADARLRAGTTPAPERVAEPTPAVPPGALPGPLEPGEEPGLPRKLPDEALPRAVRPPTAEGEPEAEAGPRLRPPRSIGEPPEPEPVRTQPPTDIEDLPTETVIQGKVPHDVAEAQLIYGNTILDSPAREAAIYHNPENGEFMVVQGRPDVVGVGENARGELEAPQPGGTAQRWKEVLESPDTGRWELLAHYHPADLPGGNTSFSLRLPSGGDGDFGSVDAESVLAGGEARTSRIHYLHNGRFAYTDFGVDPASTSERYWVNYASPVTGARSREAFATVEQYHEWYQDTFGFPPTQSASARGPTPAMPRPPSLDAPPQAVRDEIETIVRRGPTVEPVPAETVRGAKLAFERGQGSLGDFETLLKQAAADARLMLAASDVGRAQAPGADHSQYEADLAELSWLCLRGNCGPGRDYMATSLATFLMDAEAPLTIRRYQALDVFAAQNHAFAVVELPGQPPVHYLLDPTFAQFMRPKGETFRLNQATANVLSEHPEGAFMARDLLRNGYVPLTPENAAFYARGLGVPEEQAQAMGARLFGGEQTVLTEQVGGPERLPPVTRIGSNIDTLSAEDVHKYIGEKIPPVEEPIQRTALTDGADEGVRQRLSSFRERIEEALRRGPLLPEAEREPGAHKAAAGIPGSPTFGPRKGDPPPSPAHVAAVQAEVPAALDRLAAAKALPDVEWQNLGGEGPPRVIVARGRDPVELVTVTFRVGDTPGGEAATFGAPIRTATGELELEVTVSKRHPPEVVERAISHELTEIAHPPGTEPEVNRLAPGGGKVDGSGPIDQLGGHDRGRLAEVATLARDLTRVQADVADARLGGATVEDTRALRLRNEAELLAAHLGLVFGPPDAVAARTMLALRALAAQPEAARLLAEAIEGAHKNPFLQQRTGGLADLDVLANRRALAMRLGQAETLAPEQAILGSAQDLVVAAGIVGASKTTLSARPVSAESAAAARKLLSEAGRQLLDAGIAASVARGGTDTPEQAMGFEVRKIAANAAEQELVRQRYADRANYQELDEFFKRDPQGSTRTIAERARLTGDWLHGKYMAETGLTASLVGGDQPDFGFKVLKTDMVRKATGDATIADPAARALANERQVAIQTRNELEASLDPNRVPAPTGVVRKLLDAALTAAVYRIQRAGEWLGVLAGEHFAQRFLAVRMPDLKPVGGPLLLDAEHLPDSAGANTIDRGYESVAKKTLVVLECKAGEAGRGVRNDITGQLRVEQGTREYLEAVADRMEQQGATVEERDFGRKLREALQTGSMDVEYYQVRQRFNPTTGEPEPYVVDQFNLRARRNPGK